MKPLVKLQELIGGDAWFVPRGVALCALTAGTVQIAAAAQWAPIGPRGDIGTGDARVNGRIASIQIHESTGYLYVGASSGGIWVTDPTGSPPSWSDLGRKLPNPSVGAFAVHPSDRNDILVGTGDWRVGGAGMYHTKDGGGSWGKVPSPANAFYRIAYSLNSPDVVFAASDAGLFRSEHGPEGPWINVRSGSVSDFVLHPSNGNIVFACRAGGGLEGGGVYKSTDGGQTWALKIASYTSSGSARVAICRNSPNVLTVVWESNDHIQAIHKSSDGGESWPDNITGSLAGGGNETSHALAIAIAPNNPNEIYLGFSGIEITHDSGMNWTGNPNGFAIHGHEDITQLYFSPLQNDLLYICNDGGLYEYRLGQDRSRSLNGDSVNGLQVAQIHSIDARRNLRFAGMQDDGINGSIDRGATWKQFHGKDGWDVIITNPIDQDPSFWYLWGYLNGLSPTARGTFNGSQQNIILGTPEYKGLFYDRFTDRVFAVEWKDPQTQMGQVASYPPLANGPSDGRLEAQAPQGFEGITGSYLDGQTLYLWVKNLSLVPAANKYNLAVLRRSGQSWNVTTTLVGVTGQTNPIQQVVASKKWSGEAWAVLTAPRNQAQVFHSMDYGATWTDITGDLKTTVLFEGFEGNFPSDNGWSVGDDNPSGTEAFWARVNSSFGGEGTHSGAWKGYCAGSAYSFDSSEPNPVYQDSMTGFVQRSVNLGGFTSAELRFWYKIPKTESRRDLARVLVDTTGVWTNSNNVTDWTEQVISLDRYVGGTHTLRFEFVTDSSVVFEGWFLDDIQVIGFAHPVEALHTLAASPFDSNELYIGTGSGEYGGRGEGHVFRTLDGGRHWEPFQEGLPLVSVTDMIYLVDEYHNGTDKLVIGTYGRGMYERSLDRPGPVYVDQRRILFPFWDGTIEWPWPSIDLGINATPSGGYMLLNGSLPYQGSRTLTKQMKISAYEFPAYLGQNQ